MVVDKGKKMKVEEKSECCNNHPDQIDGDLVRECGSNHPDQIDGDLVHSIEKLQEIQDDLEKINEEASDKVLEVEQKYNEIRKPVYDKRSEIVKSIPDFWLTAFLSHPALGELLTEEDQKIFKHLISLEVEDFKDVKSGYSITFNFEPNPYFEDTKLVKSFTFLDEGTTKITATSINWKEGMGIPNGVNHDKKGNKRPFANDKLSFFSWFSDIDKQQKDDMEEVQDDIAELIKEDLWPNPLTYFSTEADEEDFDGEEADEEGKDDDESDQDEK